MTQSNRLPILCCLSSTTSKLVHCHAGISRSTAAMEMLMAQLDTDQAEDEIFGRLVELRPKAWPNSRMIGFADRLLARKSATAGTRMKADATSVGSDFSNGEPHPAAPKSRSSWGCMKVCVTRVGPVTQSRGLIIPTRRRERHPPELSEIALQRSLQVVVRPGY